MKHVCTGIISKQKLNRRSGWENCRRDKKKHVKSRSNVKVLVIFFLWEGRRSSWVFSAWTDSQWTVLLGGYEAFEGGRAKEETTVVPQPPNSPDLSPCGLLLFTKLKSTLKGCQFQMIEELEENSLRDLRIPGRVPEVEKTLEAVYRQWRGVLWRRQVLLSCKLFNKYFKKKVRFLFGQTTY
jgi:hypothetical protein